MSVIRLCVYCHSVVHNGVHYVVRAMGSAEGLLLMDSGVCFDCMNKHGEGFTGIILPVAYQSPALYYVRVTGIVNDVEVAH